MKPASLRRRAPRGMALVVVLSMVVLLTLMVGFAIQVSGQDNRQTAKAVTNITITGVTESALQYGRSFFSANYQSWNTYLALDYSGYTVTATAATAPGSHPELQVANLPSGYKCAIYARDDADELPPAAPNPQVDNNLRIFVGAVCLSPFGKISELMAPIDYSSTSAYTSQGSGGTQGNNNLVGRNNSSQ
jgi:hypothetical protein